MMVHCEIGLLVGVLVIGAAVSRGRAAETPVVLLDARGLKSASKQGISVPAALSRDATTSAEGEASLSLELDKLAGSWSAVLFDGRSIPYEAAELDELVPAYAISVHKSQGNEYPAVILPHLTQHYMLLQRNLVYTAITRGKKLVVIVGTRKALGIAIRNNKTQERYTLLRQRLAQSASV